MTQVLANTPKGFETSRYPVTRLYSVASSLVRKIGPGDLDDREVLHYSIPNVQEYGTGMVEDGGEIESDKWVLEDECVLISKLNPRKATVCLAVPSSSLLTVASTEFIPLATGSKTDNRFLNYLLQTPIVTDHLTARTESATRSHQRVNPRLVTSLVGPWPDSRTRQQVVEYLDRETAEIDAFIAELLELSALISERLKSEAAELLTSPSQTSSEWVSTHLGPLISIATGQVDPQKDPYKKMSLIAPNHIEARTSRLLGLQTAEDQSADSGKYLAKEGQVLFSKIRPTLMKSTLAPIDCLTSADMYPIDANPRFLTNEFLLEYLLGPQFEDFAARESARVAMPKLNRETLSSAPISLPPLEHQHRTVEKMQKARLYAQEQLTEAETAIRLGKERRAALISAAVTGQIDVTAQGESAAEQLKDELEVPL